MSSTTSRSAGDAAPTPPVFSYAQAAKGRTVATSSGVTSTQPTSGVSTPAKGTNSAINTPSGGSVVGDQSVNGSIDTSHKDQAGEGNTEPKVAMSAKSISQPGTPNFGSSSTSTLPKEEKDEFTLVGASAVESTKERISNAVHTAEKTGEVTEGRRGKKGKKQKNAEREAAEKEKEREEARLQEQLVPAPLPAVNIWAKRKEEAAKIAPPPASTEPSNANDTLRSPEAKRRGKPNGVEDGDKAIGSAQNGGIKDSPNTTKAQKKANEAANKSKEDQTPKRAGPRGSRVGEKEEKSVSAQLPPPVEDATSWPTPETALEEEKRKAHEKLEKEEKDDTSSNKPRPKKEWQTLPYVPSVSFNTPLPSRGGRGRGGARGGRTEGGRSSHTNAAGTTGDKAQNGSTTTTPSTVEADKRVSRGEVPRAASLPPNSNKRPSSDPSGAKDQRKPVAASAEKPRGGRESNISDIRNTSYGQQTSENSQDHQFTRADRGFKSEDTQGSPMDVHAHQKSGAERKSESNLRGYEQTKEHHRERADGRSDRGRGGFRGRGNHNFQNGQQHPAHLYTNGHGPQQANGYPVRQGSGPYSPPPQASAFNNQYPVPPSRGRGGSRTQSIPNSAMYGRYPQNGGPNQHMSPIAASYDFQPMQPMSAPPFNPYMDQSAVISMVKMQLEYYFSIDNLCKDVYLRKHMDSQGFVFLTFISSFKRIQALTQDFSLLYIACQDSDILYLIRGDDGNDRLRRRDGWEKWILPMEDRDESVRNAGPQYHHPAPPRSQFMDPMMYPGNPAMSPPPFSPNGTEASFRTFGNGVSAPSAMSDMNGMHGMNGNGHVYHPETPLSAAVPDFAPGLMNGNGSADPLELESTFGDIEVANLTLVFSPHKSSGDYKPKHTSASRTFSNGSIDGISIAEAIDDGRQGRTLTNGSRGSEASPESLRGSRSPFGPSSPTYSSSPPVMWVKGQRQQAPVAEHNSRESYTSFRARALKNRDITAAGETHPDMKLLYEFWSHFLCRNFNIGMYSEFRQYAFEDASVKATNGLKNLVSYYDEVLNSKKKVIPETLARHYVDLVKAEDSDDRPAFQRLRAAWRNGALDMKSRKKIDNYVDAELREELEKGPKPKSDIS
ncbi:hypothetical protein HYFRA_00010256 [Hymenoscyphus fraxineus]|uniref:HTH La-type RNA-binding domain-containing protein n=1 Tax=Hymenoscyphus fraxineus TaxID=746836 RepID=A0A9N9KUU3_9HELO|nr:hypothetical protein HYFRA_00010256 [Hymenoscyphus fraxineus]